MINLLIFVIIIETVSLVLMLGIIHKHWDDITKIKRKRFKKLIKTKKRNFFYYNFINKQTKP